MLACVYDLRVGGAETSLLAELSLIRQHGVEPSVLCLGNDTTLLPKFDAAGIPVYFVKGASRFATARGVARVLREQEPDLVHTLLFWPDVIIRPLARVLGFRVVTSLTNEYYGPEHRANSKYGAPGVFAAQLADFLSARCARRFHAISQRSASVMSRRLWLRSSRVDVIYRGRDLAHFGRRDPARRDAARAALGVGDETLFLCVGRQDYQKAHEVAVKAFSRLSNSRGRARLVLAGRPGGNTATLTDALAELGHPDNIHLVGERSDIGDLLSAADFFVMPSRFEGLGGSVVEAMALEVPLVLTDLAIFREVADERAWFFQRDDVDDLAAVLERCLTTPYPSGWTSDLRARVEEHFDIRGVAKDVASFYFRAAGRLSPP